MTNTQKFAIQELALLKETTPDALILPFTKQILDICEAFGESGQSGGSAPYVAHALAQAIKKLCLQQPICEITDNEKDWVEITGAMRCNERVWQHSRCSALFKKENGKCDYLHAIIWQGEEQYDTFSGSVYGVLDGKLVLIRSSQNVRFPFVPKTFYIDVVRIAISKEEAEERGMHYIEDGFGECYYTIVKDNRQLEECFSYYER